MRNIRYPVHFPVQETIDLSQSIQFFLGRKIQVKYGKKKLVCTVTDIDYIAVIPIIDEYIARASAIVLYIVDVDEAQVLEEPKKKGPGCPPKSKDQ